MIRTTRGNRLVTERVAALLQPFVRPVHLSTHRNFLEGEIHEMS